jgi:hypothetical protein
MLKFAVSLVIVILLLIAPGILPVHSAPGGTQQATAEPTQVAPVATQPAVVIVAPQEPKPTASPAPVITEGQISILAAILIGIVSAIAGALASGFTGVRLIVKILESANHDPALLTAIEGLTKSVPVEIVQALNLSAQIVEKVTDGAPNLAAVDAQVKRTLAAIVGAEAEPLLPMSGAASPDITAVG